jgi:hypothetical protein
MLFSTSLRGAFSATKQSRVKKNNMLYVRLLRSARNDEPKHYKAIFVVAINLWITYSNRKFGYEMSLILYFLLLLS